MVNLTQAEHALDQIYLPVITNQLNTNTDHLLSEVEQSSRYLYGKDLVYLLKTKDPNNYLQAKSSLATFKADILISELEINMAAKSAGVFVNLLNTKVENMIRKTQKELCTTFYSGGKTSEGDRVNGLRDLFDLDSMYLYNIDKQYYSELKPQLVKIDKLSWKSLGKLILKYNDEITAIVCSMNTYRSYLNYCSENKRNINTTADQFHHLLYEQTGISIIPNLDMSDNELYLIDICDFEQSQLCDWQWLRAESGHIIREVSSLTEDQPKQYKATLVKYLNYICKEPNKQIKIMFKRIND